MQELESLLVFVKVFDNLAIPYMVSGSIAGTVYGEPRLTHDVDIVLNLESTKISPLCDAFSGDEFYIPALETIRDEMQRDFGGNFNILHVETGFKADLYLFGKDPLHQWAFARRRKVEIGGEKISIAPPEYVIIRKLEYLRMGGSDKHTRDINGILSVSRDLVNFQELNEKIHERDLQETWRQFHS